MNIEFETRVILSGGFSNKDKVELIQRITNFKKEDIEFAINKQYEDEKNLSGQIYAELARLSWKKENKK